VGTSKPGQAQVLDHGILMGRLQPSLHTLDLECGMGQSRKVPRSTRCDSEKGQSLVETFGPPNAVTKQDVWDLVEVVGAKPYGGFLGSSRCPCRNKLGCVFTLVECHGYGWNHCILLHSSGGEPCPPETRRNAPESCLQAR
jgi:hypothetical protein